jgi:hypothetical protein
LPALDFYRPVTAVAFCRRSVRRQARSANNEAGLSGVRAPVCIGIPSLNLVNGNASPSDCLDTTRRHRRFTRRNDLSRLDARLGRAHCPCRRIDGAGVWLRDLCDCSVRGVVDRGGYQAYFAEMNFLAVDDPCSGPSQSWVAHATYGRMSAPSVLHAVGRAELHLFRRALQRAAARLPTSTRRWREVWRNRAPGAVCNWLVQLLQGAYRCSIRWVVAFVRHSLCFDCSSLTRT